MSITPQAAMVLLVLSITGCALRMPPPPPTPDVEVLAITQSGMPANYPQHWERDTLLVDLQGVSGSGRILLQPRQGRTWPVRLAFRVTPGAVGVLEVYAGQRSVLPITSQGGGPVELTLDPGAYSPGTGQIAVVWRPQTAQ